MIGRCVESSSELIDLPLAAFVRLSLSLATSLFVHVLVGRNPEIFNGQGHRARQLKDIFPPSMISTSENFTSVQMNERKEAPKERRQRHTSNPSEGIDR